MALLLPLFRMEGRSRVPFGGADFSRIRTFRGSFCMDSRGGTVYDDCQGRRAGSIMRIIGGTSSFQSMEGFDEQLSTEANDSR